MAVTYDFRRKPQNSAGFTSSVRSTSASYREPFQCIVTDPADENFNPATISPADVLEQGDNQGALPVPGLSVWTDGARADPFSICNGQRCRRHDKNFGVFEGESTFASPSFMSSSARALRPRTIPVSVADYSAIWELTYGEHREVMYEDLQGKLCRLPTGTYYTQPFFERYGIRTYTITQVEGIVSSSQLEGRMWAVNDADWNPDLDPDNTGPGKWLIDQVMGQRINVPIQGNLLNEGYLCQYRVKKYPVPNDESLSPPLERTWWDTRALFDHLYLESPGDTDPTEFTSKTIKTIREGMINQDGTKRGDSDPGWPRPAYETYRDLRAIDFSFINQSRINPTP